MITRRRVEKLDGLPILSSSNAGVGQNDTFAGGHERQEGEP